MRARITSTRGLWLWGCECGKMGHLSKSWLSTLDAANAHVAAKHPPKAQRYRCTFVGCNPELWGESARDVHADRTGHRTAKWPKRSAEGKRRARQRNRSGYYDRYNVGKVAHPYRRHVLGEFSDSGDDSHPFSSEALGQD